jgi:NADH-quinone oxidoreductase subunit K
MLTLQSYLTLGAIIFSIGVIGIVINRKNIIIIMMCTELLLIAVNFNFIAFSYFNQDLAGQIFVFFILTVAAAEAAIGLAILVTLYRNKKTIDVQELNSLRN